MGGSPKTSKSCVLVCVLLCAAVSCFFTAVYAQNGQEDFEFFVDGNKYQSILDYKQQYLELLSNHPEQSPPTLSDEEYDQFIESFLDVTLEKFNDDDLKRLVSSLQDRREDLFPVQQTVGPALAPSDFVDMQSMLKEYETKKGEDTGIDINVHKMKTIVITPKPEEASSSFLEPQTDQPQLVKYMNFNKENFDQFDVRTVEEWHRQIAERGDGLLQQPLSSQKEQVKQKLAETARTAPDVLMDLFWNNSTFPLAFDTHSIEYWRLFLRYQMEHMQPQTLGEGAVVVESELQPVREPQPIHPHDPLKPIVIDRNRRPPQPAPARMEDILKFKFWSAEDQQ